MSSQPKPHRTAAKTAPFSQKGALRSHASRSAITTSLRKAKRGQMIEMKRHMKLTPPSSSGNPYQSVTDHVKETISEAESIVRCCSDGFSDSLSKLSTSLERLCVLISPSEIDNTTKVGDTRQRVDASYDSSSAGIAANAILSHTTQYQNGENYLAFLLADALAMILDQSGTAIPNLQSLQSQAAIALTQLSATEPPPPPLLSNNQEQFSPYGHPDQEVSHVLASSPTSWCYVVVNSRALGSLVQKTASLSTRCEVDIAEKCVWAIGNLAGDSEMAREGLTKMNAQSRLVKCTSFGLSSIASNPSSETQDLFFSLLRNSTWALVNFSRERSIEMNYMMDINFASLLALPLSAQDSKKSQCSDIVTNTCWLLAFFTQNDSNAGELCCGANASLMHAILTTFFLTTDSAIHLFQSNSLSKGDRHQLSEVCLCLVPICHILRNIAYANDADIVGSMFPPEMYLASKQTALANPTESSLSKLIALGTLGAGQDASSIACKAAETAGVCLFYAGLNSLHPCTTACKVLIPALCQALNSQLSAFDLKRKAVSALWDATSDPKYDRVGSDHVEFETFQHQLLIEIVNFSVPNTIQSLTDLLLTNDTDTMDTALSLIQLLLKRIDSISPGKKLTVIFEELGLVDTLWRICDSSTVESTLSEMAADIIDNYYEDEEDVDERFDPPYR